MVLPSVSPVDVAEGNSQPPEWRPDSVVHAVKSALSADRARLLGSVLSVSISVYQCPSVVNMSSAVEYPGQ